MESRVIDTLRYADRLKEAGIETRQAEAMSRAINAELTEGLVTKTDLDKLGTRMMAKFDELSNGLVKQGARTDSLEHRMDGLEHRMDGLEHRMDGLEHRMDGLEQRLTAVEVGLASLKVEVEALASRVTTQGRHVFLVLALIAGLGLYNAAAPHLLATSSASQPAAPPPATATAPKANS